MSSEFAQTMLGVNLLLRVNHNIHLFGSQLPSCWFRPILSAIRRSNYLLATFKNNVADVNGLPDSKVHGANMGPIWGRKDPGGPHVGPMKFAIWADIYRKLMILQTRCLQWYRWDTDPYSRYRSLFNGNTMMIYALPK